VTVQVARRTGPETIAVQQTADVPALNQAKTPAAEQPSRQVADGTPGYLHHIRVPLPSTGNIDEFTPLDIEFGRYTESYFDSPAVERGFMVERLDPTSGAVILAATMERRPVELTYTTAEYGNIFFDAQPAVFDVTLTNRTDKPISGKLAAQCSGPGTKREQNPF